MATLTTTLPLSAGEHELKIVLKRGYSMTATSAIVGVFVVTAPLDQANVAFPLEVTGITTPNVTISIWNRDTNEFLGEATAGPDGSWSYTITLV